jgi:hypothetical protein
VDEKIKEKKKGSVWADAHKTLVGYPQVRVHF